MFHERKPEGVVAHGAPTFEEILDGGHVEWKREHEGIPYVLSYWGHDRTNDGHGMWNYYLILRERQFPGDLFDKHIALECEWKRFGENSPLIPHYDYYAWPFTEFEHMNGGITYYSINGVTPELWVKVGCDYGHLGDAERGYPANIRSVELDAKRQIEQLRELFPGLLWWSRWDGKYYPTEEEANRKPEVPA
jgi:hypothetical protein